MSSSAVKATDTTVRRGHVAVCPFPFYTHPATLLHVGRKIAAAAPDLEISLFTVFGTSMYLWNYVSVDEERNVNIYLIDDGLEGNYAISSMEEAMRIFMGVARESIRKSIAVAEEMVGVRVTYVVADAFLSDVCREIAEEKGVEWAAVWTTSAAAMAAHMNADELRSIIGVGGIEAHKDETVDEYIPGFPPIPISDLPQEVLAPDSSTIARQLNLMPQNLPKAAAVAINSFDHLESAVTATLNGSFDNKFLNAGLYLLTLPFPALETARDSDGCLPWLDTHLAAPASVVYISFGTSFTPTGIYKSLGEEAIATVAEGLEAAGVPFLWSITAASMAYLPEGFMERTTKSGRGKFSTWPPHMSVLSHAAVGAQFTDCGWDAVMASMVTGVPMICWGPAIADQMFNKRLVESVWGIGLAVEGEKLTKSAVEKALDRVLLGEEGKRMREKIGETKRLAVEAAAEPDGSSAQNLKKFVSIITS